jgi:hypothetical protein
MTICKERKKIKKTTNKKKKKENLKNMMKFFFLLHFFRGFSNRNRVDCIFVNSSGHNIF